MALAGLGSSWRSFLSLSRPRLSPWPRCCCSGASRRRNSALGSPLVIRWSSVRAPGDLGSGASSFLSSALEKRAASSGDGVACGPGVVCLSGTCGVVPVPTGVVVMLPPCSCVRRLAQADEFFHFLVLARLLLGGDLGPLDRHELDELLDILDRLQVRSARRLERLGSLGALRLRLLDLLVERGLVGAQERDLLPHVVDVAP